jgi:hypothetical protein
VEEYGASSYTPGVGNARSVYFYCVDNGGNRRLVSEDFAENLFGQIPNFIGQLGLGRIFLYNGLVTLGSVFLIIGIILSVLRQRAQFPQAIDGRRTLVTINGQPAQLEGTTLNEIIQQAREVAQNMPSTPLDNAAGGSIKAKLQELEDLYQIGLITREEYDATRQRLLDEGF